MSVGLCLPGNGTLLSLTKATVRTVFHNISRWNALTKHELSLFDQLPSPANFASPNLVQRLSWSIPDGQRAPYSLHPKQVGLVGNLISNKVLSGQWKLSPNDREQHTGKIPGSRLGSSKKVQYICLYGIIWIVEFLPNSYVFAHPGRDYVVQTMDRSWKVLRFEMLTTLHSDHGSQLAMVLRDRGRLSTVQHVTIGCQEGHAPLRFLPSNECHRNQVFSLQNALTWHRNLGHVY